MKKKILILLVAASLLLSGCTMKTMDQLYSLPKRSQDYYELQTAIDRVMPGLSYCAPVQGEDRQTVQLADLTGDGVAEAILFAKGAGEKPLKVFVFAKRGGVYTDIARMEFSGTAFSRIEYAQLDGKPGQELIIGRQMGNELLHTLSAYSFEDDIMQAVLTAGYTRFLTFDLDADGTRELFVLRPGSEAGNGVAELYRMENGLMERAMEAVMSVPVENLKRIVTGGLWEDTKAVFVASAYDENTIITDVYALVEGRFTNVSLSADSATSVKTIRNYYVYADDIDGDGLIELPALVQARDQEAQIHQDFIRWYNLTPQGQEEEKIFTFHNYTGRWFVRLNSSLIWQMQVSMGGDRGYTPGYVFTQSGETLFTIYAYTGENRDTAALEDGGFILSKTDEVTYGAVLGTGAQGAGITQDTLTENFNFIREDWKTGET